MDFAHLCEQGDSGGNQPIGLVVFRDRTVHVLALTMVVGSIAMVDLRLLNVAYWPAFDTETRAIMVIGDQWHAADDPLRETRLAIQDVKARTPPPAPLIAPL